MQLLLPEFPMERAVDVVRSVRRIGCAGGDIQPCLAHDDAQEFSSDRAIRNDPEHLKWPEWIKSSLGRPRRSEFDPDLRFLWYACASVD
jgi:hypothetical protein